MIAGSSKSLAVLLALLSTESGGVENSPRSVRVSLRGLPSSSAPAVVALNVSGEAPDGESARAAEISSKVSAQLPGSSILEIPFSGPFRVEVESERYWAASTWVGPEASEIEISVFEAASLRFEPTADGEPLVSDTVEVELRPAPGQALPKGVELGGAATCVLDGVAVDCRLPALLLDLRIAVEGFVPSYVWDADLAGRRIVDLGELAFLSGGSIAGFVTDEHGEPQSAAEVEAGAPKLDYRDEILQRRLELLTRIAGTNERGFFQIHGLEPGTYEIRARKEGFSESMSAESLSIRGDLEAVLVEPLVLRRTGEFELILSPPVDPYGKPWTLRLFRPAAGPANGFSARTVDGAWRQAAIAPGSYVLLVTASNGARWLGEEIEIQSGAQTRQVEIPLVRVNGLVSRGGEPVDGRLIFVRREGGAEVKFWLDDEGQFEGALPGSGRWDLQFQDEGSGGALLALEVVEVPHSSNGEMVRVDIEIPDTSVSGVVVDRRNRPVDKALVYVTKNTQLAHTEVPVDEEGEFVLLGLSVGRHNIFAGSPDGRTSDIRHLEVEEEQGMPQVRLVLLDLVDLEGQVVAEDGQPIVGAKLVFWPLPKGGSLSPVHQLTTGVAGEFSKRVPPASEASLFATASGFGAMISRCSLDGKIPLGLVLSRAAGTLRLGIAGLYRRPVVGGAPPPAVLLGRDGAYLPLGTVLRALSISPRSDSVELAAMSSGQYSLCVLPADLVVGPALDSGKHCKEGFLPPGGQLELVAETVSSE